ncbi:MAG: DUF3010 family protein [Verrucomicrobia bacterium]|nr:DUF3010 family protein [Verrucomicrobiota bacterium]
MRIIGIELDSNLMNYVVAEGTRGDFAVKSANRLTLSETRSRSALVSFQDGLKALFNSESPDILAIKDKPETGRMRAGSAALKMEALALANAPCEVDFVSGARVNHVDETDDSLYAYLQPALKTALAALERSEEG